MTNRNIINTAPDDAVLNTSDSLLCLHDDQYQLLTPGGEHSSPRLTRRDNLKMRYLIANSSLATYHTNSSNLEINDVSR